VQVQVRVPLNDLARGGGQDHTLHDAVAQVLSSGWYVHGKEHRAFEEEFAAYCGAAHCVGVASGTDALELALRAVARPTAGSVLTAANAGGYTSVAARRAGFSVTYADVDPATLCLDPTDVESRLEGVAVVVLTHLYGRLGPAEELASLCRERGTLLVEDCAQAAGAVRGGRRAGSFGDAATFSFYPTKNLAAVGDGGAVTTMRDDVDEEVRRLRQYGWSSKYVISEDGGRNSRLDELQAAVLRRRLQRLDEENARRREIVARYVEAGGDAVRVLAADDESHVAHLAVAVADERDQVRDELTARGVQTDVHYPVPDHQQPAFAEEYAGLHLPVTEHAALHVLTLPCFPQLTDDEVGHVCDALQAAR
jgi:aminotransferase EvaB